MKLPVEPKRLCSCQWILLLQIDKQVLPHWYERTNNVTKHWSCCNTPLPVCRREAAKGTSLHLLFCRWWHYVGFLQRRTANVCRQVREEECIQGLCSDLFTATCTQRVLLPSRARNTRCLGCTSAQTLASGHGQRTWLPYTNKLLK